MKKYLGYVVFIIIGVLGAVSLMIRCETVNNISQESNVVETFA